MFPPTHGVVQFYNLNNANKFDFERLRFQWMAKVLEIGHFQAPIGQGRWAPH